MPRVRVMRILPAATIVFGLGATAVWITLLVLALSKAIGL